MSLLPEDDKRLITKGWERVDTGQPIKTHYQFYSFSKMKWLQCNQWSPNIVSYSGLYRKPKSILAWIIVGFFMFKLSFAKKPILKK